MTEITVADLAMPDHARAVMALLETYAKDIMGGGNELTDYTRSNLITELRRRRDCCVILAWTNEEPAGLAICFEGFSTFACKPTLNIHDFVVAPRFRGQGLSKVMLDKIQSVALERKCCKITLEVLEGNHIAQRIYKKFGFAAYELDPKMGQAMFFEKKLNDEKNFTS